MAIVQVTDHATDAVELLLQQFKGKVAIEALVSALTSPLNEYETASIDLLNKRIDIDAADGVQLDGIGGLLGCSRQGLADAAYRVALRQEIALHASTGSIDDIIAITGARVAIDEYNDVDADVLAATDPDFWATSQAEFEARTRNVTTGDVIEVVTQAEADELFRLINRARPAGVYFVLFYRLTAATGFAFDGTGATGFDTAAPFTIDALGATDLE